MSALEKQAKAALARGDVAAAAAAARDLALAQPEKAAGYFLLAMATVEAGHIAKAIPLIETAMRRGPQAEHLAHLARLLILLRRDGEAAEAVQKAMAFEAGDALTFDTIGCVLARLGRHEASIAPFAAAVAAEPANLGFRYNLAAAEGFTGRVDAARADYEIILTADPGNARAHYALAILSRQTSQANHVSRLRTALAGTHRPEDQLRIRYALAKELEDVGDATSAFANLAKANATQKQMLGYDFARDEAIFDALEELFGGDRKFLAPGKGDPDPAPIFVVGMPRTGTTLVDRILSSHPDVGTAGELQAMPLAIKQLAGTSSRVVLDPATVLVSSGIDPTLLGEAYVLRANVHRPLDYSRFTDKLPANFLYIGHIIRALPNAKIVCLRRDPMDTVWSNYKNLFASGSPYYAYSYDLLDTARYYERFDRLVTLWERLWPGRVLQLSYEALVTDQEAETRRLLAHCELEWDTACLAFHENIAAVATPSAAQVRRPINADAIGRWRSHAKGLEPARIWLEAHGIDGTSRG